MPAGAQSPECSVLCRVWPPALQACDWACKAACTAGKGGFFLPWTAPLLLPGIEHRGTPPAQPCCRAPAGRPASPRSAAEPGRAQAQREPHCERLPLWARLPGAAAHAGGGAPHRPQGQRHRQVLHQSGGSSPLPIPIFLLPSFSAFFCPLRARIVMVSALRRTLPLKSGGWNAIQ